MSGGNFIDGWAFASLSKRKVRFPRQINQDTVANIRPCGMVASRMSARKTIY